MSATSELGTVRGLLSDADLSGFLARARQLGHDTGRLLAGQPVSSLVRLPGIDDIRRLCLVGPAERRARQAGFFHPALAARSRLGQGVHDRCEAYAYADGHVDDADRARLAIHLPFPARFVSILSRRVAAGEVWDLTVAPAELGVDERDDVLNVVNLGELLIEPGGRVIVQGNLLIFGCQHLRHQASSGDASSGDASSGDAGGYQLGVLPTPYPVDRRSGPRDGRPGVPGAAGAPGRSGVQPRGVPTMIGFALSEPAGDGMNGADGGAGEAGGAGGRGRTGGATKTAEITIGHLTGSLTILAAGGDGGDGGPGGGGGAGGDGGDPAAGFRTTGGTVPAGRAGQASRGGDGGNGGNGGHGGISSNVFVTLPAASRDRLRVITLPASGGPGGAGGRPGRGGRGGRGGTAATSAMPRADGTHAADGAAGQPGRQGRARPAPEVFVNGISHQGNGTSP
jgi:hypothetical protein